MLANAKLQAFTDALQREVDQLRRRKLAALAKDLSARADEAVRLEEAENDARLREARADAAKKLHRAVAAAERDARKKYELYRDNLHREVMNEAAAELHKFTQQPEYEAYLAKRIAAAKYINGERFTKAIPALGGGFILKTEDERTSVDYSFKKLLEDE